MKRRTFMNSIVSTVLFTVFILATVGCSNAQQTQTEKNIQFPNAKTDTEWKKILSPSAYQIMVKQGTEPTFKNAYYDNHEEGIYVSAATGDPLFSSDTKFESATGWPSFTAPINEDNIMVVKDNSQGMVRDEVVEKSTGLHLGHLFNDGPAPTYNRYCLNSAALKFISKDEASNNTMNKDDNMVSVTATAYFASGCFWCAEAIFESLKGVDEVISGYSAGHTRNPTYEQSNTGKTGHAEAFKVIYNPSVMSFSTLVDVYFGSQDPTQANGQGPDRGSQYRSIIFYQTDEEKKIIEAKKDALAKKLNATIAAEVKPYQKFWVAEDYHQDYEKLHPDDSYICNVSIPRLNRFKSKFPELLKKEVH